MKAIILFVGIFFVVACFGSNVHAQDQQRTTNDEQNLLRTYGIKLNVDDMAKAKSFYVGKLGFEIDEEKSNADEAVLKTEGQIRLILKKVSRLRKTSESDTGVSFTLQVNDLDEAIKRMRAAGVEFAENTPRKEGVGNAIYIRDPFGRKISLMHQTIVKVEPFKEPKIYNFGFYIPDMAAGREFYSTRLEFVVRSEQYLPLDLPLGHADGTFGFMLHQRDAVTSIKNGYPDTMPYNMIVFETSELAKTLEIISKKSVSIIDRARSKNERLQSVVFEDPFGNISEIVEASQ
jgi:catechol 2,3-dioxygenase-like lactoylglutathione lyase family enzyme